MSQQDNNEAEMMRAVEALLFAHGTPLKTTRLAKILGIKKDAAGAHVDALKKEYDEHKRGLTVLIKDGAATIVTHSDMASFVGQLVKDEMLTTLSQASLEVLSIIAYRSPIARHDIEAIRGVNCTYVLRNLSLRGLIEHIDNPHDARGYLYRITFDFLKDLGIESTADLPEYEKLSHDERVDRIIASQNDHA